MKRKAGVIGFVVVVILVLLVAQRTSRRSQPHSAPVLPVKPTVPPTPVPAPLPKKPIAAPLAKPAKPKPAAVPHPIAPPTTVPPTPPVTTAPITRPVSPLPSPSAPTPPAAGPMEWHGNDTSVTHSGQVVIRNDHQWISFWAEHHPGEAVPDVDFAHNMVVGVFSGSRPADQFGVRIVNVRTAPKALHVDYQELIPPIGTVAINVTVYPYAIRVIPRSALPVKFDALPPKQQ